MFVYYIICTHVAENIYIVSSFCDENGGAYSILSNYVPVKSKYLKLHVNLNSGIKWNCISWTTGKSSHAVDMLPRLDQQNINKLMKICWKLHSLKPCGLHLKKEGMDRKICGRTEKESCKIR